MLCQTSSAIHTFLIPFQSSILVFYGRSVVNSYTSTMQSLHELRNGPHTQNNVTVHASVQSKKVHVCQIKIASHLGVGQ